jgi:cell division protein FtsB
MPKPSGSFEIYNQKILVSNNKAYRISPFTIVTLIIFFVGSLGIALSFAVTADIRNQINTVRREIQEQKEANTALRAESTQRLTLDEVMREATGRLGMNKPDHSQIIYINVPKQSHVVLNPNAEEETDATNYFLQGIISFFSQFKPGD